ncbi:APC family permease [Promethearchaeum syntrophicum]|uniref:APC family permease n=1 Tax=Promethearchaeum syntrophicum TaxID=2594042 RepID=A0A5B9D6C8_9ARCH|nr:APC family permease [Candidatus Prometheoarchaeum syntrophicum]QEE14698.1 putative fructoselysine transporter [Candidatus Prometheoarchaeum syntrophicum]
MAIDEEIEPSVTLSKKNQKKMGMLGMLKQALGGTIGGPIFAILGIVILKANSGLLISLILSGLLMILFIMIYSELALSLPIAGGGYSFSKEAIGGLSGFLIGWGMWIGNLLFTALSGIGFALSLTVFLPVNSLNSTTVSIIGFAVLLFFFVFTLYYPDKLNSIMKILTYTLLFGFITFIILGGFLGSSLNNDFGFEIFQERMEIGPILSTAAYSFVFFCVYEWNSTFESLTTKFDEIKEPRKTIPRVYLISIIIGIVIYWLVSFVALINLGSTSSNSWNSIILDQSDAPLADIFGLGFGNFGIYFIGLIGMIATTTSINSGFQMSTHLLHSMARDGFLNKGFLKKNKKQVQWVAMGSSFVLIIIITFIADINLISEIGNFIFLLSMVILSISLIILRNTRSNLIRPWKVPLYPFIPIMAIIASLILIFSMFSTDIGFLGVIVGIILILMGIIYYLFSIARRTHLLLLLNGSKFGISIILILLWSILSIKVSFNGSDLLFFNISIYLMGCIGIISLLFDLFTIRRILPKLLKDEKTIVIGGITHHSEKEEIIARRLNFVGASILIFIGLVLLVYGILILNDIFILSSHLPSFSNQDSEFLKVLFFIIFITFGIILIINGLIMIFQEIEVRKMVETETNKDR